MQDEMLLWCLSCEFNAMKSFLMAAVVCHTVTGVSNLLKNTTPSFSASRPSFKPTNYPSPPFRQFPPRYWFSVTPPRKSDFSVNAHDIKIFNPLPHPIF